MSRYSATTKDGRKMDFGYDRPLQEYFYQVYDRKGRLRIDRNSSGGSMVKSHAPLSNSAIYVEIAGLMSSNDFDRHHDKMDSLLLDLEF